MARRNITPTARQREAAQRIRAGLACAPPAILSYWAYALHLLPMCPNFDHSLAFLKVYWAYEVYLLPIVPTFSPSSCFIASFLPHSWTILPYFLSIRPKHASISQFYACPRALIASFSSIRPKRHLAALRKLLSPPKSKLLLLRNEIALQKK